MKITIALGPFFSTPPAPCGAVERLWHDLAIEFARRGHEVTVVCRAYEGLGSDETIDGVRYVRRMTLKRNGRLSIDLIKDLIYSLRILPTLPQADILTVNVFWLPMLANLFRRRAGKLIVNVHRFPKKQLWIYKGADRFATVSTSIRDAIAEQSPKILPITRVFPNPINAKVFVPPKQRPMTPRTIVYTGRVHQEKGLHLLVKAFAIVHAQAPDSRLRIIGPTSVAAGGGGEPYLDLLRREAGNLPVEIVGPIYDRDKLAEALHQAHVYTYPSLAEKGEALPIAPIEAMATGLVPVVSQLDCFRDYVVEGQTGYYFDHRSDQAATNLANTLLKVLLNPEKSDEIGRNAARKAAEFSTENVATLYLKDYAELLASSTT